MMMEQLIARLRQAGLDLSAEEIADALWLAERLDAPPVLKPSPQSDEQVGSAAVRIEEVDTTAPSNRTLSDLPLFASDALTVDSESEDVEVPSGFSFKAPAAKALPNAVSLSRALRSLSRKVPSHLCMVQMHSVGSWHSEPSPLPISSTMAVSPWDWRPITTGQPTTPSCVCRSHSVPETSKH